MFYIIYNYVIIYNVYLMCSEQEISHVYLSYVNVATCCICVGCVHDSSIFLGHMLTIDRRQRSLVLIPLSFSHFFSIYP